MSELFKHYGMRVKKGDYIFKEGDPADSLYLIHRGRVQISKDIGDADEKILVLGEGQFIGEMAIINAMPRSANAIAVEDCELIRMDRNYFENSVYTNRQFAMNVIQFLSDRLRITTEAIPVLKDRQRSYRFMVEILHEMLISGRKDRSGRFCVLDLDNIIDRFEKKFSMSTDGIISVIDRLSKMGKIKFKNDRNDKTWIALDLLKNEDS